eukprot:511957_1
MAASETDELLSTLQINGKGWNPKLFISKIPDVFTCQSCNSVCKDAVELGCDHDDSEIDAFCKQCLVQTIKSNNNQCPINAAHKNPSIASARSLRKQILSLKVHCPNGKHKDDIAENMVYDTSVDQKEGGNIGVQNNNNKQQCNWNGTLKELISEHIQNCNVLSDDVIVQKIKRLTQKIGDIAALVNKSNVDNDSVTNELKVKIDNLNNLLQQQKQLTHDKSLSKEKQISNLTSQVTKQQNDIKNLTNQMNVLKNDMNDIKLKLIEKDNEMKKYKNDINAMVEQKHNEIQRSIQFPPFEWDPATKSKDIHLSNFNKFIACTSGGNQKCVAKNLLSSTEISTVIWRLTVRKLHSSCYYFNIGYVEKNAVKMLSIQPNRQFQTRNNSSWAKNYDKWRTENIKVGDTFEFAFNFNTRQCTIHYNDQMVGLLCDNLPSEIYPAITISNTNSLETTKWQVTAK